MNFDGERQEDRHQERKGRLSQADIDKMVADAEKNKAQDEEASNNAPEGNCCGIRNSMVLLSRQGCEYHAEC